MLQTHPSSLPEQGLVWPALISIAGQWKSVQWGVHRPCDKAFLGLQLSGIPPRDLLTGSHQCPHCPSSAWRMHDAPQPVLWCQCLGTAGEGTLAFANLFSKATSPFLLSKHPLNPIPKSQLQPAQPPHHRAVPMERLLLQGAQESINQSQSRSQGVIIINVQP